MTGLQFYFCSATVDYFYSALDKHRSVAEGASSPQRLLERGGEDQAFGVEPRLRLLCFRR